MTKNIFEKTKNYIENYSLNNHHWFEFMNQANQSEFLSSQEGFYYAVKAFPRMLSRLASIIEDSEHRVMVIENLWEEHGQGNSSLFHTNTFHQYLRSLGLQKEIKAIAHNPWVDEWIDCVLNKNLSPANYASYLAGIEYIYARISKSISDHVLQFDLSCEQSHYKNHSALDFEHAAELLKVAVFCNENQGDLFESFKLGVQEFVCLYDKMTFLTNYKATQIAKEKVAFYYAREDASIETQLVKKMGKDKKKIKALMICSGGENLIELLSLREDMDITALDINPNQISLAKAKIDNINEGISNELVLNKGKFEKIFELLANKFNEKELIEIANKNPAALKKLKYVCDNIFSNINLEIIFTKEATQYSKKSFSDHFYNVFCKQINAFYVKNKTYSNIGCILGKTAPINYQTVFNKNSKIDYFVGSFEDYFSKHNDHYDLIDLSNISDWMSKEKTISTVKLLHANLNKDGYLIGRKILGDYNWIDLINNDCSLQMKIEEVSDNTSFYTQTIIANKA